MVLHYGQSFQIHFLCVKYQGKKIIKKQNKKGLPEKCLKHNKKMVKGLCHLHCENGLYYYYLWEAWTESTHPEALIWSKLTVTSLRYGKYKQEINVTETGKTSNYLCLQLKFK